jgi:hypothetical protein
MLCTATGVTVDVTLNKYSSQLPDVIVLALWAVPAILLAIWIWQVERTHGWVKKRFLEHPVSYVIMFLILIPFGWQATATMISKVHFLPAKERQKTIMVATAPPKNPAVIPNPAPTPTQTKLKSSFHLSHEKPTTMTSVASSPTGPVSTPVPVQTASLQPTYGAQTCIGSACAQGQGSSATFNQFGPPVRHIKDEQSFITCLRQYPGTVGILDGIEGDGESVDFAYEWLNVLRQAGWNVPDNVGQITGSARPIKGMMISIHGEVVENQVQFDSDTAGKGLVNCIRGAQWNGPIVITHYKTVEPNRIGMVIGHSEEVQK